MATLNINGRKVTVDDSFLSMPPDQQNATVEEIAATIGVKPEPKPKPEQLPGYDPATIGVRQGATFNFGDEIMAGMTTPIEMAVRAYRGDDAGKGLWGRITNAYDSSLQQERALTKRAQDESPVAFTLGSVAGGLVPAGQALQAGRTLMTGAGSTASMAARAGAEGAIYGALSGAGEGEGWEDRRNRAVSGAGFGAVAGGALGAGASALAARNSRMAAPAVEELRAAKDAAYKAADEAGVVYTPEAVGRLRESVVDRLTKMGFDPANQPGAAPALRRILDLEGQNITMTGLDTIRKVAGGGYKVGEKSNNKAVSEIIEAIDDVMTNPGTTGVLSGNADDGIAALKEGRALASRVAKSDRLNFAEEFGDLRAAASGSGANADNAVRQNVLRILKDPRGFSKEEQDALRQVVKGSPVQNIARLLGKAAPTTGGLNMLLHGSTAYGTNGLSVPFAIGGALAKKFADTATTRNVAVADALIRAGGKLTAPALTDAQRAVAQALNAQLGRQINSLVTTR